MYVCDCICANACGQRSEDNFREVSFLFPLYMSQGLNSGYQACRQAPLSAAASCWPVQFSQFPPFVLREGLAVYPRLTSSWQSLASVSQTRDYGCVPLCLTCFAFTTVCVLPLCALQCPDTWHCSEEALCGGVQPNISSAFSCHWLIMLMAGNISLPC